MNPKEGGQIFPERNHSNHNGRLHIPPRDPLERGGKGSFLKFLANNHPPSKNPEPPLSVSSTPLPPIYNGPTERDKDLSNNGIPTIETEIADFVKQHSGAVSLPVAFGIFGGGIVVGGGGVFLATKVFASEIDSIPGDTSFSTNGSTPQIVRSEQLKKPNKNEVFDNEATKGVISKENTVQMTSEEYQKIAPPVIEKSRPGSNEGPDINMPITIKTAGGEVETIEYDRSSNVIEIKNMQKGNIFASPVTFPNATVFYEASVIMPDGTVPHASWIIEGVDETGSSFYIHIFVAIPHKPSKEIPRGKDYREGNASEGWFINTAKMPKISLRVGKDDFFQIVDSSINRRAYMGASIPGFQMQISGISGLREDGKHIRGGGAHISIVSIDNKAVVLK